jgi:hypothetical protein
VTATRIPRAGTLRAIVYQHLHDGWTDVEAMCIAIERAEPYRAVNRTYVHSIADAWRCDQAADAWRRDQASSEERGMTPNQTIEPAPEGGEMRRCELCEAQVPFDTLVPHVDVSLCAQCDAKWRAHFEACVHRWEPHQGDFDEGRYCTRCTVLIADEDAVGLFPLICDGWVNVDG